MRRPEPLSTRIRFAVSRWTMGLFRVGRSVEIDSGDLDDVEVIRAMMLVSGHPFESEDVEIALMRARAIGIGGDHAEELLHYLTATAASFQPPSDPDARYDMIWMLIVLVRGVEAERASVRLDRAIRLLRRCGIGGRDVDAAMELGLAKPAALGSFMPTNERNALKRVGSFVREGVH